MLCLRPEELKSGMRLARPIFNKQGVMLYERNTKLTKQSVNSIINFGLLGVFVLEPTEPVPDITEEERNFERFQTMAMFALKEELDGLTNGTGMKNIENLAAKIIKTYGGLAHKINFIGSLRSGEDYIYKHSLNVAILCAIISSKIGMGRVDQMDTVIAALIHEVDNDAVQGDASISSSIKVILNQNFKELSGTAPSNRKLLDGTRALRVADVFDSMTEMGMGNETYSQITVVKYFLSEQEMYGDRIIGGLVKGINILNPGVCVELTNGTRALVIKENPKNLLRPMLLGLDDNNIYDLSSDRIYSVVQIRDILKTMDKRVKLSENFIEQFHTEQS